MLFSPPSHPSIVVLATYAAQAQLLLARGMGCEIHTVDSFQV